jgi:NADH-quinone oxidoreductase subunit L
MIFRAFHGPLRLPEGVHAAHESGGWMTVPLMLLSIGAIGAGAVGHLHGDWNIHAMLRPVLPGVWTNYSGEPVVHDEALRLMILSGGLAVAGILAAAYVYRRRPLLAATAAFVLRGPYELLLHKYYVDELYDAVVVTPLRKLGRLCYAIDRYGIDVVLWLVTAVPRAMGFMAKESLQQGALQGYAMGMVVGLLVIVVAVLSAG